MTTPLVSVIIPVFRVEKYLTKCIQSVRNQTLKNIEIIIIDEGEEDRCKEIIDYFASIDPRIIAPHIKHGGYSSSCNYAFSLASGEFISIIESDDWIDPEMLETLYTEAERLGADVIKGPYVEERNGKSVLPFFTKAQNEHIPSGSLFSAVDFPTILRFHGSIWTALYRREFLERKGILFVKEKGGAYVDMVFRYETLTKSDKLAWYPVPFYHYLIEEVQGAQHNNHGLDSFMRRWEDLHKRLDREEGKKRFIFQAAMLPDELNDTFYISRCDLTKEELDKLHKNLSNATPEIIKAAEKLECHPLEKWRAQHLEKFLKSPQTFYDSIRRSEKLKKIAASLFSFSKFVISDSVLFIVFASLLISFLALAGDTLRFINLSNAISSFFNCSFWFLAVVFLLLSLGKISSFFIKKQDLVRFARKNLI